MNSKTTCHNNYRHNLIATRSGELAFAPMSASDIRNLTPILHSSGSRSCDFSVGGIFMWVDYFGYESCVADNTLFIRGLSEDFSRQPSFSLPTGRIPLPECIDMIRQYCTEHDVRPFFSAVPEDRLGDLISLGAESVEELTDWADYIYRATDLATLSGKRYNKKRNHVNRFIADNPGWKLETLDDRTLPETIRFFDSLDIESEKSDPAMAEFEREQCMTVLRNFTDYPFEGAVLRDGSGAIAAFTAGEIIGDTLILHIEKMRHEISGAGEAINKFFAERMLSLHPGIVYINREDDSGDPGLRYAKESYHPEFKLRKFNVMLKNS